MVNWVEETRGKRVRPREARKGVDSFIVMVVAISLGVTVPLMLIYI